jgi:hypothetical protein
MILWDLYVNWCEMKKVKKVKIQLFSKILETKFEKQRIISGIIYNGIKIL